MKIYLVGGAVRDEWLGLPVKEKDWVVVGATVEAMIKLGYKPVGKDFPVFLHPVTKEEYALARTERKVGKGYKGFVFNADPNVTLEDDLRRRDLTINAMAKDGDNIIDPYGGQQDLKNKILRHVSPAFAEDPVRILRLGRFAARFYSLGFELAEETLALMKEMVATGEVDALVAERVWKEVERALSEKNPEVFFIMMSRCGALAVLFPYPLDVAALSKAALVSSDQQVRFAVLCHALAESQIKELSAKYRLPSEYRDLALLLLRFGKELNNIKSQTPEAVLNLLKSLDAFRREERFNKFLKSVGLIQPGKYYSNNTVTLWLREAFEAAKSITSKKVKMEGLSGKEIADALDHLRVEAIEKILADHSGMRSAQR